MKNSIENTWKNAFADNKLLAPKLVGLYEKKSEMIIDKIMRRMKLDNWFLIPLAAVSSIIGYIYNYTVEGLYGSLIILFIFGLNLWVIRKSEKIDLTREPLVYLKSFMEWIKSTMRFYKIFLGLIIPIIIAPVFYMILSQTEPIQRIIQKDGLVPVVILIIFLCFCVSVFSLLAYSISNKTMYGGLINRIKEVINDLEELKSQEIN